MLDLCQQLLGCESWIDVKLAIEGSVIGAFCGVWVAVVASFSSACWEKIVPSPGIDHGFSITSSASEEAQTPRPDTGLCRILGIEPPLASKRVLGADFAVRSRRDVAKVGAEAALEFLGILFVGKEITWVGLWETDRVNDGGVTPFRNYGDCWGLLCPYRHSVSG